MSVEVVTVATKPFSGQKPGTSGLRKKVKEVKQENYLENFVQSVFNCLPQEELKGSTLVVSGDGRYHNAVAISTIIRMAAANEVGKIILGQDGLMSTPCVSAVVREKKAYGALILTASHNPGGPEEDFGIKYNCQNGGPAPESLTDKIFEQTKSISSYKIAKEEINLDISKLGEQKFGHLIVEVIDAPAAYIDLMKQIFDFDGLKKFVKRPDFKFIFDAMYGAGGPFGKALFEKEFGVSGACLNCEPKPDFGGGHPDPNLTYAHDLVEKMGLGEHAAQDVPDFGAAADGDADRNMILGRKFFVTPSDSVAIIAANYKHIPYFKGGLKGVARSMPTSAALDRVAQALKVDLYEVPTGWKFFGNLMDAGKLSICGEESFGTGSDHIREKDGLWAILAWLSLLQGENKEEGKALVTVEDIVTKHWHTYGRNYYSRYDYEGVESEKADKVISALLDIISRSEKGEKFSFGGFDVQSADEFTYVDPVDQSVSKHQGIRILFTDGSRIVYRLSGTGSVGATIRVYIEKYEPPSGKLDQKTADALQPLIKVALDVSKIPEFTGREKPTVIT